MNTANTGMFISYLRNVQRLSPEQLASFVGVYPEDIISWETGGALPDEQQLFRLAYCLGVKPETILNGHFTQDEMRPSEKNKLFREYIFALHGKNLENGSVRVKRLLAWAIDYAIIYLLPTICVTFATLNSITDSIADAGLIFSIMAGQSVLFLMLFCFRDYLFNGRFVGKRLLRLEIIDRKTGEKPIKGWKFFLRSAMQLIISVDFIVLLAAGRSLGDMVCGTTVISKDKLSELESIAKPYLSEPEPDYRKPAIKRRGLAVLISLIAAGLVFASAALINKVLLLVEDNLYDPQCVAEATDYFVESKTFEELGVSEFDVENAGVSIDMLGEEEHDGYSQHAVVSFRAGGEKFEVILHLDDGEWQVCTECTDFD